MSQSAIMSFKKYFMPIASQELHLSDTCGWGWFVDTDTYNNPFKNANELKYKKYSKIFSRNLDVPSTIYEFPTIRSMKSMKNLEDMANMYETEDIFTNPSYNTYKADDTDDTDDNTCNTIVWSTIIIGIYYIIVSL
jgi:hypothetical protein